MTHLFIVSFFITIVIGAGAALQLMVKDYWQEITAALRIEAPVRKVEPARFTVTLRPRPPVPLALRPSGAAA